MLKTLRIKNVILIETAEIEFKEGFNVLSGETGSGKSAIMNAIHLIAGNRADSDVVRKDTEKAVVEAIFNIQSVPGIETLLEQSGIDFEDNDELYIKREISSAGKSRAFINNQPAQLNLLKAITSPLLNIVGQHATQDLFSLECHRDIVDIFGELKSKVAEFALSWDQENLLKEDLDQLIRSESERLREIEVCEMELEELKEANLKEAEDEDLFKEYSFLIHAEEISEKVDEITKTLSGDRNPLLTQLHRQKSIFEDLAQIDPNLTELSTSFNNVVLELQEVANSLNLYQSRLEQDPERLQFVNERLALITRMKKKYGSTLEEIYSFIENKQQRLDLLQNADERIDDLKTQLEELKNKNQNMANSLTEKRTQAALQLAKELKNELLSLNMPNVDFEIDVSPHKRTRTGDDRLEFYLLPNVGERRIPIKDCASGGELSRVMLSLQKVLSGKQKIFTLIFDEIDANIGGETASIVGDKLKTIGIKQQVLCITHFPQVAKYADHHLQISKKTVGERTLTFVNTLDETSKDQELLRMKGY
jgi:DNA repair protein RecN (Recombination protein N)